MKRLTTKTVLFPLISLVLFGCSGKPKDNVTITQPVKVTADTVAFDTVALQETFQDEDTAYNEYLADRLRPIRINFKRINSISSWTSTDERTIRESSEGGEAIYYYNHGILEKTVTHIYGETFQILTEYYLLNGQLSFVFEKTYQYNRPIYYDTAVMKESKDDQAFNIEKSEMLEDRSYFEKGKLIHQVNNQDCGTPFEAAYLLKKQMRLQTDFDSVIVRQQANKNKFR